MPDNSDQKNAANKEFRKARAAEDGKRAMLDYENVAIATRAKTAKLRALRLARDVEQAAAAAAEAEKPKVGKKKKAKSPSVADVPE